MPLQAEWQSIHITQVRTNPSFNNHFLPQNYDEKSNLSSLQSKGALSAAFPPTVLLTTCALNMAVASIVTSSISKQILNAERLQSLCAIQADFMSIHPNFISDAAFPRFPMGVLAPCLASVVRSVNQATAWRGFPSGRSFSGHLQLSVSWNCILLPFSQVDQMTFVVCLLGHITIVRIFVIHTSECIFSSMAPGNLRLRRQFPKLM